jgi:Tol biopolymer transport system component
VLFEELTSDGKDWNLVLANLDGSQKQLVASKAVWGALSPDGTHAAFSGPDGTMRVDLASGKTTVFMAGSGYDIHWSPDGTQVALVNPGGAFGVFVANADGSNQRQLSNLGYESIAGWSPDGKQVYFAVPGSTGDGFLLKAADVTSGSVKDLFVLKDSSRKAPMPSVSPDGKWIAYRGSDNASLYLMSMDGVQQHLVMDNPAADAISGLAWSQDSAWLGVSLLTPEVPNGQIVLVKPEGCQAYLLPGLVGNLDGLVMP